MTDTQPLIVDAPDKVAFRDGLGHDLAWGYAEDATAEQMAAFHAAYEQVKNGDDDYFHTDGGLYQGTTLMRVIRRISDGKLFGYAHWQGGGKYGEAFVEHNGDDHGFPSRYNWEDGVEEDELWWVFLPVVSKPLPAYVFEADA
jgi:hypothetical protein